MPPEALRALLAYDRETGLLTWRKDRGVSRNGNGFRAQISIEGKLTAYPTRPTAEEAYADYCAAAVKYHGEHARLT